MFVVNSNSVEMIKRLKKNIKDTKPAVDAHKTILFPLDYSFKAIGEFSGESGGPIIDRKMFWTV